MPTRDEIEHLLRRTEYVARPDRVDELLSLPSLEAAVANILDVSANPPSVEFAESGTWRQGIEMIHFWLDRMAHDSHRPVQEKMAFFWHGHFCSELNKISSAEVMREQIDLFRRDGLTNFRSLAIDMSTQVAMLRYLDNNQNRSSSPNQNFARELLELFLLGVGNYTEADVEAATSAWTGHTDRSDTDEYVWRGDWHDASPKQFLGVRINDGTPATRHGAETIEVVLGNGAVPGSASVIENAGRLTRDVAAEYITRKMWAEFAGTEIPPSVLVAVRDVALAHDFDISPWLAALLSRSEFYLPEVRRGRVRTPVEFVVACLVATGRRSTDATPDWLLGGMGQRPLYPPHVAGWGHNGYWVNASFMASRMDVARSFMWKSLDGYWSGDGRIRLANGTISKDEIYGLYDGRPVALVDRLLELMQLELTLQSRDAIADMCAVASPWERTDVLQLIFMAPEFHLA